MAVEWVRIPPPFLWGTQRRTQGERLQGKRFRSPPDQSTVTDIACPGSPPLQSTFDHSRPPLQLFVGGFAAFLVAAGLAFGGPAGESRVSRIGAQQVSKSA